MKIEVSTLEAGPLLTLEGRFDAHETEAFRAIVEDVSAPPGTVVYLDLGKVRFVDSSALAELLRSRKRILTSAGDLRLARASDAVRVILELTALNAVFPIVDQEAIGWADTP